MDLPALEDAPRYRGLYAVDFGGSSAVGYTADEVALLLESEQYRGIKVYKIVRAAPNGAMELRGVSHERFGLESGMFFLRKGAAAAERDFADLLALAEREAPPARAFVQWGELSGGTGGGMGLPGAAAAAERAERQFVTALIYPAEYEDEMAAWLSAGGYAGGDFVEGGISCVTSFYHLQRTIHASRQLMGRTGSSRSRAELYASIGRAVQR